jgi:hypothetical protein
LNQVLKVFNQSFSLPSKLALNKKMKNISMIGNPLGRIRKDVIRVREKNRESRSLGTEFQLGTDAIMKYLRNRLTVDDGSAGGDDNKKTFDIPKAAETEDERKRRLYTEHHVVRSTGTFDIR